MIFPRGPFTDGFPFDRLPAAKASMYYVPPPVKPKPPRQPINVQNEIARNIREINRQDMLYRTGRGGTPNPLRNLGDML